MSTEVQDPETLTQEAVFDAVYYWKGKKLHPFSFARHAALQRLKTYGSPLETAAMMIVLCLDAEDIVDAVRGDELQAKYRLKVSKWAHENGLTGKGSKPAKEEADRIAGAIWEAEYASDSEPDLKRSPTPADPKEPRLAEQPNTSPRSRRSSMAA